MCTAWGRCNAVAGYLAETTGSFYSVVIQPNPKHQAPTSMAKV